MQLTPKFKILTEPTDEPVTDEELAIAARVSGVELLGKLRTCGIAARKKVELDSGIVLMTTVFQGLLDAFPYLSDSSRDYRAYDATYAYRQIGIPYGPIQTFDSLQYVDTAGVTQTWAPANYRADLKRTPSRITPEFGLAWPINRMVTNAVTLQFTAGYASAALVPELAKQAIYLVATDWIRNLEADPYKAEVGPDVMSCYRSLIHALHWMVFDE